MGELHLVFGGPWASTMLLVSARTGALLLMTPLLHAVPLPVTAKVLLVLGLSAALALPLAGTAPAVPAGTGQLLQAFFAELMVGATLGLGVLMAFSGFALAGRLLDVQVGFGIAQVFDPLTRTQAPVLSSAFGLLGVVLFLLANGHHVLLRGLAHSLERFPPGQPWAVQGTAGPVLQQAAGLFTLGFALAAPVVLMLLLVEFALGVVARNLPQANMFLLGIPAKILAGLLLLSFWAAGMGTVTQRMYEDIHRGWSALFAQAAPAAAPRGGR